jgi:hypothetical protein
LDRAAALAALEEPLYDPEELRQDKAYIAKKLGFSADEFEALMQPPGHHYSEYANQDRLYQAVRSGKQFLSTLLGRRIKSYG